MREPNFSFPNQNRAAICITSSIYDRRALDCTDYIPIINTLTNLAYLTGSTPTIREFVTRDGGLERLVTILKNTKVNDRKNGLKWTLAFQCVVNIGVRGTEHIRKRVVQAGMVPVIVNVLESFFAVLKSVSDENERKKQQRRAEAAQQNSQSMITEGETVPMDEHGQQQQGTDSSSNSSSSSLSSSSIAAPALTSTSTTASVLTGPLAPSTAPSTAVLREEAPVQNAAHYNHNMPENTPGLSAMPVTQEPSQGHPPSDDTRSIPMDAGEPRQQQFFYREDDILHSLQLLAYLSKYPSLRSSFHTTSGSNVFAIVEKFTYRNLHPLEIQYWAGVIMRNACRKDDTRKGIRQCAYTGCGKWETKPREFAKCRRCRKAKYCSKQCQSKAWNEGHRWWCIEKKAETMGVSSSFGTDLPPAPPPPPPPADLQDQPDADANLMENGGISSVGAGTAGTRMIGSDGGGATGHSLSMRPQALQQQHQHHPGAGSSSSSGHRSHVPSHASSSVSATPGPAPTLAPQSYHELARQNHHHHQHQQQQQHQQHQQQQQQQQQQPQNALQRQQLSLPQQFQPARPSQDPVLPNQHQHQHHRQLHSSQPQISQPLAQNQLRLQQMRVQQLQHRQQARYVQSPLQQQPQPLQARPAINEGPIRRSIIPAPQRAMTHPHPSTAPIMPSPRSELTPHLGISPDSPTPEQLAQRFVQQVALHPGQHNELAQQLNAQFQQYFSPSNQAEAKRQFSFHARDHFARYQRQQELLRNSSQGSSGGIAPVGRPSTPVVRSAPLMTTTTASHHLSSTSGLGSSVSRAQESELAKQGTPRRRSDVDSDDDESLVSGPHSTMTSLSMPMLTQDLSTTMSLSSIDLTGSLGMAAATSASSSAPFQGSEVDTARADPVTTRDFKVRKLMAPEESSSPSTEISGQAQRQGQGSSQPTDEWSYSRHMAKDATTIDS
ncbi:hypothetical protein EC968_008507 [Mortierella alpina]|nr:hypothetical protein EC968_008507 [Mortierella alpina]